MMLELKGKLEKRVSKNGNEYIATICLTLSSEGGPSPPFPTGGFRGNVNMNALL